MAGPAKARRDSFATVDAPVPPHSIEAEQAVIGGLLLDAAAWDNVADVVKQEDFYRPDHQQITLAALFPYLKPGGTLALELGDGQGNAVNDILVRAGYRDVRVEKDLARLDRLAFAKEP